MVLAEQTFIILDKEMVDGKYVQGNPHVEGERHCRPFFMYVFSLVGQENPEKGRKDWSFVMAIL